MKIKMRDKFIALEPTHSFSNRAMRHSSSAQNHLDGVIGVIMTTKRISSDIAYKDIESYYLIQIHAYKSAFDSEVKISQPIGTSPILP